MQIEEKMVGIFKVLKPVLDQDEKIRSDRLKAEIRTILVAGQANVSIDFSHIDHIASDTVGTLIALNTSIQKLSGRFVIINIQDWVLSVLDTAGVPKILKILKDEGELKAFSNEITTEAFSVLGDKVRGSSGKPDQQVVQGPSQAESNTSQDKVKNVNRPKEQAPESDVIEHLKNKGRTFLQADQKIGKSLESDTDKIAKMISPQPKRKVSRKREKGSSLKWSSVLFFVIVFGIGAWAVLELFVFPIKSEIPDYPLQEVVEEKSYDSGLESKEPPSVETNIKPKIQSTNPKKQSLRKVRTRRKRALPSKPKNTSREFEDFFGSPSKIERKQKVNLKSAIVPSQDTHGSVFIATNPPVAEIFLGDKLIGKSNIVDINLPIGKNTLKFRKGNLEVTKELIIQKGKNPPQYFQLSP